MADWIVDIARIIQATFSVLAAVGIAVAFLSWRSKQAMDQRATAIGYSLTRNPEFFAAWSALESTYSDHFASGTPIPSDRIRMDRESFRQAKIVLAHWEIMAISIFDDIMDERTCFEMVGSTVVRAVAVLDEFISETRKKSPRRYDYVLMLADVWLHKLEAMEKKGPTSRYEQYLINGKSMTKLRRSLASYSREF